MRKKGHFLGGRDIQKFLVPFGEMPFHIGIKALADHGDNVAGGKGHCFIPAYLPPTGDKHFGVIPAKGASGESLDTAGDGITATAVPLGRLAQEFRRGTGISVSDITANDIL